jgi:JmjC domain.
MTDSLSKVPDMPSDGFKEVKVYDLPPTSFSQLRLPRKSRSPPFHVDKDILFQFEKSYCPENPFRFNVDISHIAPPLSSPLYQPAAILYSQPENVPMHIDGTMEGSLLVLVVGRKIWRMISPYDNTVYSTVQEEGETVYVPPGYHHSVITTSPSSIAYGAMWTTPQKLKYKLICLNRIHFKKKEFSNKETMSFFDDCVKNEVLVPTKSGKSLKEKLLKDAGKRYAIEKGGSTRRCANGRRRQKSHFKVIKNSKRRCRQ